jgi:hypothetical protein
VDTFEKRNVELPSIENPKRKKSEPNSHTLKKRARKCRLSDSSEEGQ